MLFITTGSRRYAIDIANTLAKQNIEALVEEIEIVSHLIETECSSPMVPRWFRLYVDASYAEQAESIAKSLLFEATPPPNQEPSWSAETVL